jgi:alpha-L-fucosidase
MRYAVLTVKHDSGFCLWDSKVMFRGKEFDYDVAATDYKTDVVQAFVDACKKYGIPPGFYYCLADVYADKRSLQEMFRAKGAMTDETFKQIKAQLSELTANYPACEYYWLDVPNAASIAQQGELYDLLRRANPNNVVLMNQHLAAGAGGGPNLLENKRRIAYPVDVLNTEANQSPKGKVSKVQNWNGEKLFMGYEHCAMAGSGWFKTQTPESVESLFALYKKVRGAGGNLLLNVGPTRDGTMPDGFEPMLIELRKQIDEFDKTSGKVQDSN